MMKKILYSVLFIALAVGTVYSWQKLDFNRKTAMFFQVVFGDETSMGGPGGRPPMGDSQKGRPGASAMAEGGERGAPPDFGQGQQPGARPPGDAGPGGLGGPGGYVSLGEVAKYTVIMAFFVMLTRLLDQWALKRKRK